MSDASTAMPVQPDPEESGARGRRGALAVLLVSGLVVLLLAGGGFAAWRLMSGGGPQPADVLPADTLGLVSVDLDPSGGQKLAAIRALRKFPAFREQVGLKEDQDVAQALFERLQRADDVCPDLDYARDVEPWLGQRFAVAGVEVDGQPKPVGVLQVTDVQAARDGVAALQKCSGAESAQAGGVAFGEDYLVLAESDDLAQQVLDAGEKSPLSSDDAYQRWTDETGGDGIVEMYAAAGAAAYLGKLSDRAGASDPTVRQQLEDFEGAAGALRFEDGGVVLSVASSATGVAVGDATAAEQLQTLPEDTAAVFALGVSEEARKRIRAFAEPGQPGAADDLLGQIEGALGSVGLDFPDDVVTVLGDSLSVSVGGQAPASEPTGPQDIPAGLRVDGDAAAIRDVLTRVTQASGFSLEQQGVTVDSDEDTVALAFQPDYAATLLSGEGSLLDSQVFTDVVPRGEDAASVLYLRLTDSWRQLIVDAAAEPAVEDNLAPLRALGLSGWVEDDVVRGEVRLSLN